MQNSQHELLLCNYESGSVQEKTNVHACIGIKYRVLAACEMGNLGRVRKRLCCKPSVFGGWGSREYIAPQKLVTM